MPELMRRLSDGTETDLLLCLEALSALQSAWFIARDAKLRIKNFSLDQLIRSGDSLNETVEQSPSPKTCATMIVMQCRNSLRHELIALRM